MDKHTDEHGANADGRGINNDEYGANTDGRGTNTDEHKSQEITIDNVLSTEKRTLPNGNTITIIKRTNQTELIVPIRDPKNGQVFHTARVVLEPWATDPKKMPEHVREDLGRTFLKSMMAEMQRDPGAKARWDELGKEVLKRMKKKE